MRCCSTDAGSVSPCTTTRRWSSARCSPGTSSHTGSPVRSPKPIVRPGWRRPGRSPSDSPASSRSRSSPSPPDRRRPCADRRRGPGRRRARAFPPLQELGLPGLEGPLQPSVLGQLHVVGDQGAVVEGRSSGSGLVPIVGRAAARAEAPERAVGPDGVGALEDPVLPGGQAGEDLASPSSPVPRIAGWPPCRSGRRGRSWPAPRVPASPRRRSRGRPARGDEAEPGGLPGGELLPEPRAAAAAGLAPEPGLEPGQPVGHRGNHPSLRSAPAASPGSPSGSRSSNTPAEHERAIGGQRQFGSVPAKQLPGTIAHQAAGGELEAPQRPRRNCRTSRTSQSPCSRSRSSTASTGPGPPRCGGPRCPAPAR